MRGDLERLKQERRTGQIKLIKDYLSPALTVTVLSLLLHIVTATPISINNGVIYGMWIGTILRFLLRDIKPKYVYSIAFYDDNLTFYLINPIGKTEEINYQLADIKPVKIRRKNLLTAYSDIDMKKNGKSIKYAILNSELADQIFKLCT